jgi:hypothetical protein
VGHADCVYVVFWQQVQSGAQVCGCAIFGFVKEMKHIVTNKFFLLLARTIDHRVGYDDVEKPDVPVLPIKYALISFFIRFLIVFVNFVTCAFIIANIVHHW